MTWDYFAVMVLIALPASMAYPLIYGFKARWWSNWIGFALLIKATGLAIMLAFTAALLLFGSDYPGREFIRDFGITLITLGVYTALIAMLREYRHKPRGLR